MFAIAQHDGYKSPTEDRVAVVPINDTMTLYGVFDGHSGYILAAAAATTLTLSIKNRIINSGSLNTTDLEAILIDEFEKFDRESRHIVGRGMSGTTATCAIVTPTHIVVANVGDSPAVLFKEDLLISATEDHDADNPKEVDRIKAAGGYISNQNPFGNMRVNNSLSVSRALGDFIYKNFHSTVIIPTPQTYIWTRHEGTYLAVCSDSFTEEIGDHPGGQRDVSGAVIRMIIHSGSPDSIVRELSKVIKEFPGDLKSATDAAVVRRAKKFYYPAPHNSYCGDNTSLILIKL